MKICRDGSFLHQMNSIVKSNLHTGAETTAKTNTRNFDEILISTRQTPDDATFAKDIARKIAKEVRAESDTQKVEEYRAQVQSGTYQIMVDEIAKKLLLS